MMFIIYLTCLTLVGESWAYDTLPDLTNLTYDLLATYNGDYNNKEQLDAGSTEHAYLEFRNILVDIPSLRPNPVWFVEWAADGVVILMQLAIITERPEENIYLELYNFTDISLHKPREYNVSQLSNLTLADLSGHGCTAVFKRLGKAVYTGYWPDCRYAIGGNYINFVDTVLCDVVSSVIPPSVPEIFARPPYVFKRKGGRYSLLGFRDTYDSICGKHE